MSTESPSDRVVFTAENHAVAEAVIKLLAAGGIAAEVAAVGPQTVSDPLTGSTAMAPVEVPVAVADPAKVKEALELLATAQTVAAVRAVRDRRASRTGTVAATCEDCGKGSEWPAETMGTTDTCPHCGAYLDIPDPDDDWSGVDFGAPEEDNDKDA